MEIFHVPSKNNRGADRAVAKALILVFRLSLLGIESRLRTIYTIIKIARRLTYLGEGNGKPPI